MMRSLPQRPVHKEDDSIRPAASETGPQGGRLHLHPACSHRDRSTRRTTPSRLQPQRPVHKEDDSISIPPAATETRPHDASCSSHPDDGVKCITLGTYDWAFIVKGDKGRSGF
ncbi:hypothetical protein EYF80_057233 [Liparis tanakae]|uniref:Uncharacterized protein n=1 Tax=Liparis tanakae TaxID=230148 RepID=A0A4Z2EUV5_9TELE|nr:hypothetical protein EYF80_057233 [Liparis tanakae]